MSEVASSTKSRRSLQITAIALSAGAVLVGGMALGATGATAASPTDECEGSGSTSYDKIQFPQTSSGGATITYTNNWSGTWSTSDYAVRVVVKSGSKSDPGATGYPGYSGTWFTGEAEQNLSHITFCYGTEQTSSPSPTSPSPTTPPPTTPPPTTPPPTTPPPTTPPPTTPPVTTPPATPPVTTPPAATTAAATTPAPVVTATPLPAEVTAAPLPAEITAEPSAAKVEKPEVSAKPLPASVPAGGGGDSGTPPWATALVLLGGLGLVLSTGWLAVKR